MGKKDLNTALKCSNYIQVSTNNTSLGKILVVYKYPITGTYYLNWSGTPPNLGGGRYWGTWSPAKSNEQYLTSEGYLKLKNENLYLSWSCIRAPNLCPRRKWAVWSPKKDIPVEVTSDGYLKMKTENLYLSWSGYRKDILGGHRLSAVWSPVKDTPITNIC